MILEVANLTIRESDKHAFETAMAKASPIIASMKGYLGHELQRCIEDTNNYLLLVRWETLEDHTVGFRDSAEYQEWRAQLHHFYVPTPTVLHYELVQLEYWNPTNAQVA